jgi:hypothetical protein
VADAGLAGLAAEADGQADAGAGAGGAVSEAEPATGVASWRWRWVVGLLLCALLVVLGIHVNGVFRDFATAIRYPFELDYGEGIVWQQAVLIPGPRMYSTSTDLPFIVFHYPPLYYLWVHAARLIQPDWLAAGRLVSGIATIPIAACVTGLVLIATARRGVARPALDIGIAIATGALVLCLHAFRSWGMLMRVDMPAVALAMMGLLIASLAAGRFWGTTVALLLCGAAAFTKRTELPAGIAVFLIALLREPRAALGATAIAGVVCVAALVLLEVRTGGGFLLHIVGYNAGPMSFRNATRALWPEKRSLPIIVLSLVAAVSACRRLVALGPGAQRAAVREIIAVRMIVTATYCRALLLTDFLLLTLTLLVLLKHGSNYNYLLDWLSVGCALIGVMLVDLSRDPARLHWAYVVVAGVLLVAVQRQPQRMLTEKSRR